MPSLLPGYEYDIFISYRHNDNRSGWVTGFVNALREELASTIKEPLSIYFDQNAHDGLLETHHVDKSLEGKLTCLIFIPVISQTYCDPKSFAWQHEFCAFNKLSKESSLGRDLKLSNGNVSSRILPIKIHDLDAADKATIENEIGGALRSIDFIFKSPGVNRPLLAHEEHAQDNLNKTFYRDQVNKVANAVKDIVARENPVPSARPLTVDREQQASSKTPNKKVFGVTLLVLALGIVAWLAYPKFVSSGKPVTAERRSLAVLPFVDMSPGKDQEWFSDGLTEELLNSLSRLSELDLIARTSSFAFKGKNLPINKIADSLGVAYIVEGSVRKVGNQLRVTAQLIQADKGMHIWSNTYDRSIDNVFVIQENIAESIAGALDILLDDEKKGKMFSSGTRNVEAYEEYLKGQALFQKAHQTSAIDTLLFEANKHLEKAMALDKEFAAPYQRHQDFYSHYFIHHIDIRKFISKDITDQSIYRQIVDDLDAAIRLEKNPIQNLAHRAEKITMSSDWSQWPQVIDQFKKDDVMHTPYLPGGFYQGILLITNPEINLQLMYSTLDRDPLNNGPGFQAALSLLRMNLTDSAAHCLDQYKIDEFKWFIPFKKEDFSAALLSYETDGGRGLHELLTLLAGKYNGTRRDLYRFISTQALNATVYYNALGEYEKADSVAHVYDAMFLGPTSIADYLTVMPQCFHLTATPNFGARLKELGVDVAQYEKEHYYRFPVVRVK